MNKVQTSETVLLGALMALAGGFMDAYSYICRGQVFAHAQTGNLLLLGISIAEGKWGSALRYCTPLIVFILGIALADYIRYSQSRRSNKGKPRLHWRQLALLTEIAFMTLVAFLPQSLNLAANCITSLACGIQVQSFRKIYGNGIATIMCIGNLRSGTENLCRYLQARDSIFLRKSLLYFGIIGVFVLGAVAGNFTVGLLGEKSILVCALFLVPAFFMMFVSERPAAVRIYNSSRQTL